MIDITNRDNAIKIKDQYDYIIGFVDCDSGDETSVSGVNDIHHIDDIGNTTHSHYKVLKSDVTYAENIVVPNYKNMELLINHSIARAITQKDVLYWCSAGISRSATAAFIHKCLATNAIDFTFFNKKYLPQTHMLYYASGVLGMPYLYAGCIDWWENIKTNKDYSSLKINYGE